MSRRLISSGSSFEALVGYSRAVVQGPHVFLSGTTGFDYRAGTIAEDAESQARQCFTNIESALAEAGSGLADVVRVVVYLSDRADFEDVAAVLAAKLGAVRPANTTVIAQLVDPRMLVEIEVTALKQTAA